MNYLEFKDKWFDLGCFTPDQIYAWKPDFNRNNLLQWTKKGFLIKLRRGHYAFAEYKRKPDYALYFANRIYKPSYVSLHTALAFYGMIPESVVQFTSVTSLKTASFANDFGEYSYLSLREDLMFGYDLKPLADGRTLQLAQPEKALLDLLYLYPFYNTEQELEELRLDEDFMRGELDYERLDEYSSRYRNKALDKRMSILKNIYR